MVVASSEELLSSELVMEEELDDGRIQPSRLLTGFVTLRVGPLIAFLSGGVLELEFSASDENSFKFLLFFSKILAPALIFFKK